MIGSRTPWFLRLACPLISSTAGVLQWHLRAGATAVAERAARGLRVRTLLRAGTESNCYPRVLLVNKLHDFTLQLPRVEATGTLGSSVDDPTVDTNQVEPVW